MRAPVKLYRFYQFYVCICLYIAPPSSSVSSLHAENCPGSVILAANEWNILMGVRVGTLDNCNYFNALNTGPFMNTGICRVLPALLVSCCLFNENSCHIFN